MSNCLFSHITPLSPRSSQRNQFGHRIKYKGSLSPSRPAQFCIFAFWLLVPSLWIATPQSPQLNTISQINHIITVLCGSGPIIKITHNFQATNLVLISKNEDRLLLLILVLVKRKIQSYILCQTESIQDIGTL
jgi:hypothetical protein